jgi:catechol 2,3-dioxygenase-like lactoylglutathione lyase family enzyme
MNNILVIIGILALFSPSSIGSLEQTGANQPSGSDPNIESGRKALVEKITTVLYVESIEPCLRFWVDSLGFTKTAEVPEGDRLGFVILASEDTEVMLQSYASLDKDIPALGKEMRGAPSVLYIEVEDIGEIERPLKDYEVIVPKRKTFYGANEIFYRTPGGHVVGFAQQNPD